MCSVDCLRVAMENWRTLRLPLVSTLTPVGLLSYFQAKYQKCFPYGVILHKSVVFVDFSLNTLKFLLATPYAPCSLSWCIQEELKETLSFCPNRYL